jgi:hypothetical protein
MGYRAFEVLARPAESTKQSLLVVGDKSMATTSYLRFFLEQEEYLMIKIQFNFIF